ncbi:hypothetical protein [Halobacillus sp. KGW1]|uniref:hypothetical protein n=1 Tax=Halobacillus sp. KGW1 TaxID=1793726 RepID=UPI0007839E6B|nr:hypothetical protein [Halobacillus sp. KGW1]
MQEELTFKSEINRASKALMYIMGGIFALLGTALLSISIWVSRHSHWVAGLLSIFAGSICLLVGIGMLRDKQKRYTSIKKVTKEGFYEYFHLPEREETIEKTIPFAEITALYAGRAIRNIYRQEAPSRSIAYPVLVLSWEEEGQQQFRGMGLTPEEWKVACKILPEGIPVYETEYELTHYPDYALGVVLDSTRPYGETERGLAFPHKLGVVKHGDVPVFIPEEKRQEQRKKEEAWKKIGERVFNSWLLISFLLSLFWMPFWEVSGAVFAGPWSYGFTVVTMLILGVFRYAKTPFAFRNFLMVGRDMLLVLASFMAGGLLGYLLFSETPRYLDAAVNHAFVGFLSVPVAFLLSKFLYFIGIVFSMMFDFAGMTRKKK